MAIDKGLDLQVKIGANTVGAERGVTLTLRRNLIDVTTKDDADDRTYKYGTLAADVSFNGLYVFNDTAQDAIETAIQAGTSVTADITTGTSGEKHFSFTAYITSWEISAATDDGATFSGAMNSSGAITYADV